MRILRSCLGPEPGKLIEGISLGLNSAWRYLDQRTMAIQELFLISSLVTWRSLKQLNPGKTIVSVTLLTEFD